MGFLKNLFGSAFTAEEDFDLDSWTKQREENEAFKKLEEDSRKRYEERLFEMKMIELNYETQCKIIEDNVLSRKNKLDKLRNPKSIYLRKKEGNLS